MGRHASNCGDYKQAQELFSEALKINQTIFGMEQIEAADTLKSLSDACAHQRHYQTAVQHINQALEIYKRTYERALPTQHEKIHENMSAALHTRANIYSSYGWYGQPVKDYELVSLRNEMRMHVGKCT